MSPSDDRFRVQRNALASLAPHPHRLELRGAPKELAWPRICANCGATAAEQLTVRKVFRKSRSRSASSQLIDFRVVPAPIPFCVTCANEHRSTVLKPTVGSISGSFFPYVVPVIGEIWLAQMAFRGAVGQSLLEPAGRWAWGFFALMMAALVWTVGLWWRMSKPSRIEPQTDITQACDFSRDVSGMLERERHIYAMKTQAFADALASLNADRVWTAEDQARSRKVQPILALGFLLALVAVAALLGVFR